MLRSRFVSLVFLIVLLVAQLPSFLFDFAPQVYATTATFGYTGIGGVGTTTIENVATGSEFTITENGTAVSITAYLTPASFYMGNCKAAIYFANNTLLGSGTAATLVSGEADWYTFTYASGPALVAGTAYVLVVDGTLMTGTCVLSYAANDTNNQGHIDGQTYSDFPEPVLLVPTHYQRKYSIYCTYTVAVDVTRLTNQSVGFSFGSSRLAEFVRAASQAVNVDFVVASLADFFRTVSQAVGTALNGGRLTELFRVASQTIALALQSIGEKVGVYLRNAALTITTVFQGSRLAEWLKTASQSISVTLGSTGLAVFVRTASQTVALAFSSVGEKLGNYVANVALTITTTLQNSRLADWTRQATQTLTLSLSTSRIAEFLALVTLTIMATVNADHLVLFARQVSQTLSFVFNGVRLIEVSRSVSQTIALTLEGFGEFVGNYFRNALLDVSFTFATLAEVPEATVLLALAIALVVIACVVTFAVAKTMSKD